MDLNFTYSDNNSPNFAGMFKRVYEHVSERRTQREENDKQAVRTKAEAEAVQRSTTKTVQTVESYQGNPGIDSKKPKPLRDDWQMVGQPRQFNRAPRVLRPGQPAQSEYAPEKPKSATPRSIRPGVSSGAQYPEPPKKPRAPRAPRKPQGSAQP